METKPSQSQKVDAYMKKFTHPLKKVMESLREVILSTDKQIGEEVKWNAPTFFYTGPQEPSDPKLYKRYLIVFNVHQQDLIMLVLPHAADIDDGSGFLEGEYKDGRRLIEFHSLEEVEKNKPKLQKVIKLLLKEMDKSSG